MGMYKYITESLQTMFKERGDRYKERLKEWRTKTVQPVAKPTNLSRARSLGYKAKEGYKLAIVKIKRGRRHRKHPDGGRKPGKNYRFTSRDVSLQTIAELKAARKFGMEAMNSYFVGSDGVFKFFEVILLDKSLSAAKGRVERGLTSSAKKGRGL
jgi:large subunit ribosomal protein L15e